MTTPHDAPSRLTDRLGRYYTKQKASEAVIAHLGAAAPSRVIDLGCGDGALSLAARNQWASAEIITVDIDRLPSFRDLGSSMSKVLHRHFQCDALRVDLPEVIGGEGQLPDVAVCNPPFIRTAWQSAFSNILDDAQLGGVYKNSNDAITEILFLAQNLRLLRKGGKLGIIVPDSIVNGKRHSEFRRALLESHTVESVVKLPRTAFQRTDAQAYIITITKGRPTDSFIKLSRINEGGKLDKSIYASPEEAQVRLDYGYHYLSRKNVQQPETLREMEAEIYRGKLSSSQRAINNSFHTTDFPKGEDRKAFQIPQEFWVPEGKQLDDLTVVRPGDILLARVGRNLEEKVCLVSSGNAHVTDCIYVIRAPSRYRLNIFNSLSTGLAHLWLKEIAHGVSARQLPKADLLNIPI